MRKKLIAGNWKMNKTAKETREFLEKLSVDKDVDILICPPFTSLESASLSKGKVMIGAQDISENDEGAFTGEVSAGMIKEFCEYTLVGHSERRAYHDEDDVLVNAKIKKALEHGLKVVLCVGEKLEERESGKTEEMIRKQLTGGLKDIKDLKDISIAYEPVWAIGTGKTATPKQAEDAHKFIRSLIRDMYGNAADDIRILYGGSVKPENAKELLSKEDIDGALIGGASLKVDTFIGCMP